MSTKSYFPIARLTNYAIAALAVALLVLEFIPSYNNGTITPSIQDYLWLSYKSMKPYFTEEFAIRGLEYTMNSQVLGTVLMLLCPLLIAAANVVKTEKLLAGIVSSVVALLMLWALSDTVVLMLSGVHVANLIITIAILVLSLVNLALVIIQNRNRIKV